MSTVLQDLRYGLQRLRQTPGFTSVALAIMALGIGANTAIFSIVNAVLFRAQPYERVEELVNIYTSDSDGRTFVTSSYPDYLTFREQTDLFEGTVAFDLNMVSRLTGEGAEVVFVEWVSGNYFDLLGLRPHLGRGFVQSEDQPGGAPVAVVGYQTWRRKFGGDPGLVGSTVSLNGRPVTIVGVGPADYVGVAVGVTSEFWLPHGSMAAVAPDQAARMERRGSRGLFVRARLKPGVTVAQAQAGLDVVMSRLEQEYPATNSGRTVLVISAKGVRLHPALDKVLYSVSGFLMVVVAMVLVIACSNLANLLLVRASGRQKEVAIRLALGANRGRLVGQLLVESTLLAITGGAMGLVLAKWLVDVIMAFEPPLPIPLALDLSLDANVLWFTLGLSLITGVLFGLAPALRSSRPDLVASLKDEQTSLGVGSRRFGLQNVLVVSQVAVSLLLLVGAGLFVRSLGHAQRIDPGFEAENAAILTVSLGLANFSEEEGREFYGQFLDRLEARSDIRSVALAGRVPLGVEMQTRGVFIEGYELPPGEDELEVDFVVVGSGYFETLAIPLLRGRAFTGQDRQSSPRVGVVSEAMALEFWGTREVVGKAVRLGDADGMPIEIVGVARDTKVRTLGERPRPYLYTAFSQEYSDFMSVVVATVGDPAITLEAMRRDLKASNPDIPIFDSKTMPQHLGIMLFAPRMGAALLSAFGILAMTLASLGLYGVVAYAVSRRTREMGIRVAIGAQAGQVIAMVIREGMALVAVGVGIGLALAFLATRPLAGLLYDVGALDPITFAGVGAILCLVALVASLIPARRAARVDPMVALRSE